MIIPIIALSLIIVLIPWCFYRYPPKKINGLIGYRTSRSMSSQDAWDFAQKYSAKKMLQTGSFAVLAGVISWLTVSPQIALHVLVILWLAGLTLSIIQTETQLKRRKD